MTELFKLSIDERRTMFQQAFIRSGIQSKAIEKDWWVTLSLKALFSTPYAPYSIFKGGTSLSKGWKLIERFSEDIDIALAPEAFGITYQAEPSHSFVKNLKRKGCEFTTTILKDALGKAFSRLGVPDGLIEIEADPIPANFPDKDPQTLFIRYPSIFDSDNYLTDVVRMEFGVRSLKEPSAVIQTQSILSEVFPNPVYQETSFEITAVEPRKTLLEKMFLLHEKFTRQYPESVAGDRQSRHLYDIVSLLTTSAAKAVIEDRIFYQQLLQHRKHYVRVKGVDYDSLQQRNLRFVPSPELLNIFEKDYEEMQRSMIYGASPTFSDILRQLKYFNAQFLLAGFGLELDELVKNFEEEYASDPAKDLNKPLLTRLIKIQPPSGELLQFKMLMLDNKGSRVLEDLLLLN